MASNDEIAAKLTAASEALLAAADALKEAHRPQVVIKARKLADLGGAAAGADPAQPETSTIVTVLGSKAREAVVVRGYLEVGTPAKVYLSPKLDRWLEFDWDKDLLAWRPYAAFDIDDDVYTVWLRGRGDDHSPKGYKVVDDGPAASAGGYVAGDLFDDYLSTPESQNVAWDQQQLGPLTGKHTTWTCTG